MSCTAEEALGKLLHSYSALPTLSEDARRAWPTAAAIPRLQKENCRTFKRQE